jgi:hypothetical protein
MARNALIVPRTGSTRSQVLGILSGNQSENEFFLDGQTKELYVGTGSSAFNGSYAKPVTYNINALETATIDGNTEIPIAHTGGTKKTTVSAIASLISAQSGDTKTVLASDEAPADAGTLNQKLIVNSRLVKDVTGTGSAKAVRLDLALQGVSNPYILDNTIEAVKIANNTMADLTKFSTSLFSMGAGETLATAKLWTAKKIQEYIASKVMVSVDAIWDYAGGATATTVENVTSTHNNSATCYHFVAGGTMTEWIAETKRTAFVGMKILVGKLLGYGGAIANYAYVCEVTAMSGSIISSWSITPASAEVLYYSYSTINSVSGDSTNLDDNINSKAYDDNTGTYLGVDTGDNRLVFYYNGGLQSIKVEVQAYSGSNGITISGGLVTFAPKANGGLQVDDSGASVIVPSTAGLQLDSAGVQVKLANVSLEKGVSGLAVKLDASGGIEVTGTGLAVTTISGGTI